MTAPNCFLCGTKMVAVYEDRNDENGKEHMDLVGFRCRIDDIFIHEADVDNNMTIWFFQEHPWMEKIIESWKTRYPNGAFVISNDEARPRSNIDYTKPEKE